ncbi:hypothetical protein GOV08_05200 [Candidatus Woesearchaeota archaeon]|nr:hypothetical protein [Candidatus Woesearchaeota archaeon]
MITPEFEAIKLFSTELSLNLTINQISKELKKPYASTNKYVRDLIDAGIFNKKVVGSAILCSLNYTNEKTLGLLMLNSIGQKTEFLKKTDKKNIAIIESIKNIQSIKSLFITDDKYVLVCEDKILAKTLLEELKSKNTRLKQADILLLDQNGFRLKVKSFNMKTTVVIEGYEAFWRLISEMMT